MIKKEDRVKRIKTKPQPGGKGGGISPKKKEK